VKRGRDIRYFKARASDADENKLQTGGGLRSSKVQEVMVVRLLYVHVGVDPDSTDATNISSKEEDRSPGNSKRFPRRMLRSHRSVRLVLFDIQEEDETD